MTLAASTSLHTPDLLSVWNTDCKYNFHSIISLTDSIQPFTRFPGPNHSCLICVCKYPKEWSILQNRKSYTEISLQGTACEFVQILCFCVYISSHSIIGLVLQGS